MKRTPIKKQGKQGKLNAKANRKIAELWQYASIEYCEADFMHECDGMLTNAHRHKRAWYYTSPELLWNFREVARLCMTAHNMIEHNAEMTEELFIRLRE